MTAKRKSFVRHLIILLALLAVCGIVGAIFYQDIARFLRKLFSGGITRERAKEFMQSFGWHGVAVISTLSMLQVVLTFLPAEPVQVVAGMSYGIWGGVGICMLGVFVGNNLMYLLSRTLGARLTKYFNDKLDVDLSSAAAAGKISFVVLILYLLPAIPYGLICFMSASTGMRYPRYILLTLFGSLPSVAIGTALGAIAIETGLITALITLVVLIVLIVVMFALRNKIFAAINNHIRKASLPYSTATRVRQPNGFIYGLAKLLIGAFIRVKVKLRLKKQLRRLPRPSVVVLNHPSFIDWIYGALAMRPDKGNFIIARYYYYHKKLAWLIRNVGTIPKSMFTADIESARNSFKVVRGGGVLCLMPEAHLSTAGAYEGIQPATSRMLKMLGVPVTLVHIDGAYLAKPKWGKGFRKGAVVETEVRPLMTAEEVKTLSKEEITARLDEGLRYDDFAWLDTRPDVTYKSKQLAEGLENILWLCPDCGQKLTLGTKGHTITCSNCGMTAELNERYRFVRTGAGDPLPEHPLAWYRVQEEKLREEMDESYALSSHVRLKVPSTDGKTFFRLCGEGEATLSGEGLTYRGTRDGEACELNFPMKDIYRLLFGAGENFEIYSGSEYFYFIPDDLRSCVLWYAVSKILSERYNENTEAQHA